jgi:hypothetical protein
MSGCDVVQLIVGNSMCESDLDCVEWVTLGGCDVYLFGVGKCMGRGMWIFVDV